MTRAEKIALLTAALQGQTSGLRDLQRQREQVGGCVIFEQPDQAPDSRVCWWRGDGQRVVETWKEFNRREQPGALIFLPDNGRDGFFAPDPTT